MKDMMNVTISVDFVRGNAGPDSGWEACVDLGKGWEPGGYEAGDVGVLLARVAADLRTEMEKPAPAFGSRERALDECQHELDWPNPEEESHAV